MKLFYDGESCIHPAGVQLTDCHTRKIYSKSYFSSNFQLIKVCCYTIGAFISNFNRAYLLLWTKESSLKHEASLKLLWFSAAFPRNTFNGEPLLNAFAVIRPLGFFSLLLVIGHILLQTFSLLIIN